MAVITPQRSSYNSPAALTFTAATYPAGDSFNNNGYEKLVIKNPTGADIDVTADAPGVDNFGFSGNALDKTITVPAGATHFLWGPFQTARHNDGNGRVQLTYTATGLQIAVLS